MTTPPDDPTLCRRRPLLRALVALPWLPVLAAGCAVSPFGEPPRVQLVGIDGQPGEGLELRFVVRLRVQNPNELDIDYDGVSLELDLRGQSFASGVAPLQGRVPRFGEVVLAVPVTVSGFALARQVLSLSREQPAGGLGKIDYRLRGRLGGGIGPFGGARFESSGELDLGG